MKALGAVLVLLAVIGSAVVAWADDSAPATPPSCEANLATMAQLAYAVLKPQRDQYDQIVAALRARVAELEQQLDAAKKKPDEKKAP